MKKLLISTALSLLSATFGHCQTDSREGVASVAARLNLPWDAEGAVRMEDDTLISWTSGGIAIRIRRDIGQLHWVSNDLLPATPLTRDIQFCLAKARDILRVMDASLDGRELKSTINRPKTVATFVWHKVVDGLPCPDDAHVVEITGAGELMLVNKARPREYTRGRVQVSEAQAREKVVEILSRELGDAYKEKNEFQRADFDLVQSSRPDADFRTAVMQPIWQVSVRSGLVLVDAVTGETLGFLPSLGKGKSVATNTRLSTRKNAAERVASQRTAVIATVVSLSAISVLAAFWFRQKRTKQV